MTKAITPPWSPTMVTIRDNVTGDCQIINFSAEDFSRLKLRWNEPDAVLIGMGHTPLFNNRTRWRDLSPVHFRFLIAGCMDKITPLDEEDQYNPNHPVTADLTWLLMGLIRCLEFASQASVDTLVLVRLAPMDVMYSSTHVTHLRLHGDGDKPTPKSTSQASFLTVVVDNE